MTSVTYLWDVENEYPGWEKDANFVFVGHGSPWVYDTFYRNVAHDMNGDLNAAQLSVWRRWFGWQSDLIARLPELQGKVLVVDYRGENTHAHYLAERADNVPPALSQSARGGLFMLLKP